MITMSTGSICGGDLTDMLLLLRYNKGIRILLCFKTSKNILYSKYARLVFYKKTRNSKKIFQNKPSSKEINPYANLVDTSLPE